MQKKYVLAIDQGTTGTTCLVVAFSQHGVDIVGKGYSEFPQHFPQPGWVEHDLNNIWLSVKLAVTQALHHSGVEAHRIEALGLTNQRETVGMWDGNGVPLSHALVWQDRRTADRCLALQKRGCGSWVKKHTGLVLDPYFSATKIEWMLQHMPHIAKNEAHCGTMDTWVLYKLTGGRVFKTDVSNASRTLLWNIHSHTWDPSLCDLFGGIPTSLLPQVCSSSEVYGYTQGLDFLPDGIPVAGMAGDQQAALFGQACFEPGMIKCTYGTGAFVLMHTGVQAVESKHGLLTTVAWKCGEEPVTYALEGSVFVAGALVQWLRDGLKIIEKSADVETLALQVEDSGGVYVVPALTGLGAPHWKPEARGLIAGVTRGSTHQHIARASLEGIAFQVCDLLQAMQEDNAGVIALLRVDGGASANNLLMQIQADASGQKVQRSACVESTALGAAYLAALGVGVVSSQRDLVSLWKEECSFVPSSTNTEHVQGVLKEWRRWVEKL
jgi:glycerol kinase